MAAELQRELTVCDPPGDPLQALLARNRGFSQVWQAMAREPDPEARMRLQAGIYRSGCQPDPSPSTRGSGPGRGC